jgi:hypothetical protein
MNIVLGGHTFVLRTGFGSVFVRMLGFSADLSLIWSLHDRLPRQNRILIFSSALCVPFLTWSPLGMANIHDRRSSMGSEIADRCWIEEFAEREQYTWRIKWLKDLVRIESQSEMIANEFNRVDQRKQSQRKKWVRKSIIRWPQQNTRKPGETIRRERAKGLDNWEKCSSRICRHDW